MVRIFSGTPLRALVAALGIASEVGGLVLEGSMIGSNLDEDWMVIVATYSFFYTSSESRQADIAAQAPGSQGRTRSYPSYAAYPEPRGMFSLARIKVGLFRFVGVDFVDCSACRRIRTSMSFVR